MLVLPYFLFSIVSTACEGERKSASQIVLAELMDFSPFPRM